MPVGKASIMRAVSAGGKKGNAADVRKANAAEQAVITPLDAEDVQVKFLSGASGKTDEKCRGPVRITEKLPDYLL